MSNSESVGDRLAPHRHSVHGNGARFRAAIKADTTAGAALPRVLRRMHAVGAQLSRQLETLRRAGLHAQPTSFALFAVDVNLAAYERCHIHLALFWAACGRCNHLVVSQYSYSSSLNLGWAISISFWALSRIDLPCR